MNSLDEMVSQKDVYMSWIGDFRFWHDDFNKLGTVFKAIDNIIIN